MNEKQISTIKSLEQDLENLKNLLITWLKDKEITVDDLITNCKTNTITISHRILNKIGLLYSKGEEFTKDTDDAFKLYKFAAELGNPNATGNCAQYYFDGRASGGKNIELAFSFCQNAIELGVNKTELMNKISSEKQFHSEESKKEIFSQHDKTSENIEGLTKHLNALKVSINKGYRTRNPKSGSGNESEGESDSEDPNIVWRGLTPRDLEDLKESRGLRARTTKTDNELYEEIKEHVQNGSDPSHKCDLMSATRSKKVAARYSSHKPNSQAPEPTSFMAKIKLAKNIGTVDLTDSNEMQRAGLTGTVKKFAENSQEVIIYQNVPQENVMAVYKVNGFKPWEGDKYELTKKSYDSFVKFRAYEKDKYFCFGIRLSNEYLTNSSTTTLSLPVQLNSLSMQSSHNHAPLVLSKQALQLTSYPNSTKIQDQVSVDVTKEQEEKEVDKKKVDKKNKNAL